MRSPSSRVLNLTCDVHAGSPAGTDRDGGVLFDYAAGPTYRGVPCSAQPVGFFESEERGRVTKQRAWRIITARPIAAAPRSKVMFIDADGVPHTLFAEADRANAGRGGVYELDANEKL